MHKLSAFSLKNRALIALVTVVIAVFGGLAFTSLKQELIPSIEVPQLAVLTVHPGASAEVVASDVTTPVEKALQTVPGLLGTTSTSSTGVSVVMAEFEFGTDTAKVEQKMAQSISRIRSYLPEGTDPSVMAISLDDFPVIQVAVSADDASRLAATLAEQVVPSIERIDGVASASIIGAPGPRVSITPRAADMAAHGVTAQSIATLLMQNGVLVPAGTVVEDGSQMAVQVGSRLASVDEIADLPLVGAGASAVAPDASAPTAPAAPVTLGDVADVELTTDATTSSSLVNGREALTLSITKLPDANTVDVSHAVQDALPGLQAQVAGSSFDVLVDQAPFIEDSISGLATEGLLGLVMAIIVILAFLRSGRATLVTAVSIPVSLLIAFVGMQAAGYTLNILSLGGLTIAIGRIVDDSIVVIENVERHMRYGRSRRRTIVGAVREVGGAITASTVTTVAVFVPIALVGGMAGVLFRPFAFTVAIAMGASLLVALTIVPVLAYWFLRWRGHGAEAPALADGAETAADADARVVDLDDELTEGDQGAIQRVYGRTLDWALGHRWTTVGIAVAVLVGTVALTPLLKTSFLGDMAQNSLGITQKVEPGTSLEEQIATARTVDEALRGVDGVELVAATIGQTDQSMLLGGSESISYSLTTDADGDQAKIEEAVRAALATIVDEDDVTVSPFAGMGMSNDVEISVTGADADMVASGAESIAEAMRPLEGVRQVSSSVSAARPTVSVVIDRTRAAAAGLTETQLSQAVAGMITPQQIGAVTLEGTSVSVYLTPEDPATSVAGIRDLPLGAGGATVGDVAEVSVVDGPVSITTQNGVRNQVVDVTPESDDLGQTATVVQEALDGVALPDGVTAEIGGVTAEQNEAFGQLGLAMLVAILIVYVVMVATFRSLLHPLLLLVSIPFAATGAILLQVATGIALGVPSLIGVLMLIGIVVTNAIVLVDLVKQYRDRGVPMADALRRGAVHRVRPILMTAAATILALAPMAIGVTGHGGFISQPLAIVVIGGLFSSTLMTLLVLPAIYHLVESIGKRGAVRTIED